MSEAFQAPMWSVELPDGWAAEPYPDYVQVRLPFTHAEMRITPYRDETGRLSPTEWLHVAEHFTRQHGRPVIPRRCGDFAGHATQFVAGSVWIRGWALRAGEQGLDVNYRCASADAGRDDAEVDAVLSTLRLRAPAT